MAKAITFPTECSLLSRRAKILLQYLSPTKPKQNPPTVSEIKRCETAANECVGEEIPDDLCGLSKMLPASKLGEAQRDTNCVLKRGVGGGELFTNGPRCGNSNQAWLRHLSEDF